MTGLTGPKLAEVSFTVAPGEILGITGLPGSGYEQLPYLVTGAQAATGGQLVTRTGRSRWPAAAWPRACGPAWCWCPSAATAMAWPSSSTCATTSACPS